MIDDYSGLQKAAILLITLGPEKASAIFQHLKEDEIESLTLEIANTRSVSPQDKESVLDEYYQVCLAQQYIAEGGIGYAKELLEKALGSEKAQGVISKLTASLQVRPFEFVRKTEPAQLLNFIQDEHPQTIAMILSYLSSSQAAMILGALPPEEQADVARRIAQMDRTSPDVIKEVERVLERKLSSLVNQDYTIVGGIDSIVNILKSVLWSHLRLMNLSLQKKSERRCLYSRISFSWMTGLSRECSAMWRMRILSLHLRVLQRKYKMSYLGIFQNDLPL